MYQGVDARTGRPLVDKFEFTYRDSSGRQIWKTAKGSSKGDAKAERAEVVGRLHRGERLEATARIVSDAARLWLERGTGTAGQWEDETRVRYERVVRTAILKSPDRSGPALGTVRLRDLTVDQVAGWSRVNERVLAPTTAAMALRCLGQICRLAVRRGWLGEDPVARLERGEKPHWQTRPVAILAGTDLGRFLAEARQYRPLFEFLAFTGMRIGEALGFLWEEVDLDNGLVRVKRQLSRKRALKGPKTSAGVREVVLAPGVVELLEDLGGRAPGAHGFVFHTDSGRYIDYMAAHGGFHRTLARSGLVTGGAFRRTRCAMGMPRCSSPRGWTSCSSPASSGRRTRRRR